MSDVVVIDAGLPGIACAGALQAEGVPVRFDRQGALYWWAYGKKADVCRWQDHYVRPWCSIPLSK